MARQWIGWLCFLVMAMAFGMAEAALSAGELYLSASRLFRAKQYKKAEGLFVRSLALFQKQQHGLKQQSRSWYQMRLARVDVLHHLALIAWKRNQKMRSCRLHQQVGDIVATLPTAWKQWTARSPLPGRVQLSLSQLNGACVSVPTRIRFVSSTPGLLVEAKSATKGWTPLSSLYADVLGTKASFRASAKGYQTQVFDVTFARWVVKRHQISLTLSRPVKRRVIVRKRPVLRPIVRRVVPKERLLLRRVVVRRRMPPTKRAVPVPIHHTWWFWTVTGVVVVGGATSIILLASQPKPMVLQGEGSGTPHSIW